MKERLQKFLAQRGVASRRASETLILEGRVRVNGEVADQLGTQVDPAVDQVSVDGKSLEPLQARHTYLWHKPPGVMTTLSDPQGRPCAADYVRELPSRVFPVGRLDFATEGALLLTDDGDLANRIMHPRYGVRRGYLALVERPPSKLSLEKLLRGVQLDDGPAQAERAEIFAESRQGVWLALVVAEGRKQLIRRLCAAVGHPVKRLYRPSHAGIALGSLPKGSLRPLTAEEQAMLAEIGSAPQEAEALSFSLPTDD